MLECRYIVQWEQNYMLYVKKTKSVKQTEWKGSNGGEQLHELHSRGFC